MVTGATKAHPDCDLSPHDIDKINSGWKCNGTNTNKGCINKLESFYMTSNTEGWRCDEHDFDLCLDCLVYHQKERRVTVRIVDSPGLNDNEMPPT